MWIITSKKIINNITDVSIVSGYQSGTTLCIKYNHGKDGISTKSNSNKIYQTIIDAIKNEARYVDIRNLI